MSQPASTIHYCCERLVVLHFERQVLSTGFSLDQNHYQTVSNFTQEDIEQRETTTRRVLRAMLTVRGVRLGLAQEDMLLLRADDGALGWILDLPKPKDRS